jgi:hypothetical protein
MHAWSWGIVEVAAVFLGFTVINTLIDLTQNSDFYFGSTAHGAGPDKPMVRGGRASVRH